MSGMMKAFKDARRRSVETLMVKVVGAHKTEDSEFDQIHEHFQGMICDMNECKYFYIICIIIVL
jgi:hypothetical protein